MTIPAGTLVFTGYGDHPPMRFASPEGALLTFPGVAPDCGTGCDGIVTLTTGPVATIGGGAPNFPTTGVGIFAPDFATAIEGAAGPHGQPKTSSARDDAGHFYGGKTGYLFQYDATGAQTADWAIGGTNLLAVAVNGAGTRAYLVRLVAPGTVAAWDLVGDASLGTFVVGAAGYTVHHNGLLALTNGDVLVGWRHDGADGYVTHYDAAATVLHTYALPGTHPGPHALTAGQTPATVWINYYDDALATSSGSAVVELTLGTGTIVHGPHAFDDGAGFEFDSSFTVTGTPPPPPPAPGGTPIRRLRQAPHLVEGEHRHRLSYPGFELVVEAGARRDGDGTTPLTFWLQWSDDGGHTWSHLHEAQGSTRGQTRSRFRWTRLGQSRDRIFRVVNSDAAKIVLVDALLSPDPEEGSA